MQHLFALHTDQRRLLLLAWITYAAYYLGRVNLATALPGLQADLALSKAQIGLVTTGFLWLYAAGQLINGWLGDRFSPRWLIFGGLLGSGLLNWAFVSSRTLPLLWLCWTLNGYMQSVGWPPMLRLLANWLTPAQRTRISALFSTSFMLGNALTWLLCGWLIGRFGWQGAFWLPAGLMIGFALLWLWQAQDTTAAAPPALVNNAANSSPTRSPLRTLFWDSGRVALRIWPLLLATLSHGFAQIALLIWLPTYYVEARGLPIGTAAALSALMPFTGMIGSVLATWLLLRLGEGREATALVILLAVASLLFFSYPYLPGGLLVGVGVLVGVGIVANGATGMLLTTMPLALSQRNDAASIGGVVNFAYNFGAGLSSGLIGALLDSAGWSAVFLAIALATALAAGLLGMMQSSQWTSRSVGQ